LELLKFASIDIGSNAVRLLFMNVIEDGKDVFFRKSELIRMPVRLGQDAFYGDRKISGTSIDRLVNTMIAFKHLMIVQNVVDYRACATSAMREAKNGKEVVKTVLEKAGIHIDIIDGESEAELVYSNKVAEMFENNRTYLYVDVGGGSTEMTVFANHAVVSSHSFNVGTIRLLNNQVSPLDLLEMKNWLKAMKNAHKNIELIGSGGNINKIFRLTRKKEGAPLSYKELRNMYNYINSFSIEDRIKMLGFNPDRADVIIPASELFIKIMKWAGAKKIYVPKIGISDGIIHLLYSKYSRNKQKSA
jgi:exopolyphosphatase / guanosine-5'-triphosphate,3'-diphosphate pyrophosphatase